ncbi:Alpha/Beta hydrolase protein [Aspergillus cavernicola]|uniref:Alpha/Beta hydrolase protein n=1 Tax=Aspergillus cavernicola TaxID=176166 RepID=A0ABR4I9S0_9EURO
MSAISMTKGPIQLAGLLFKPSTSSAKTPALVIVHPSGGVKEQTAQVYAKKFAADASRGGEPRFLEDPNERVSDIYAVVDYLQNEDSVDAGKIGIVGICAGGGYAVAAAKADHRLKADLNRHAASLEQAAAQITAETQGAERAIAPYVPPQPDNKTPYDLKEAHDYYLGPRAQHPRAENKMLFLSFPRKAGSLWHTEKLDKILDGKAKKVILPKGTHMDFYDKVEFVEPAARGVVEFMQSSL